MTSPQSTSAPTPTAPSETTPATSVPCTAQWASATSGMPTPPPALVSWYVSLFTAADFTTTLTDLHVTPPASLPTVVSAAASFTSAWSAWSTAHAAQLASVNATCPGYDTFILGGLEDLAVWDAVSAELPSASATADLVWPVITWTPGSESGSSGSGDSSSGTSLPNSKQGVAGTVLVILGILAGLILLGLFWWCVCCRRRKPRKQVGFQRAKNEPGTLPLDAGFYAAPEETRPGEIRPGKEVPDSSAAAPGRRPSVAIRLNDFFAASKGSAAGRRRQDEETGTYVGTEPPPAYAGEEEAHPFIPQRE